jgi:creatinine amidohydrolase
MAKLKQWVLLTVLLVGTQISAQNTSPATPTVLLEEMSWTQIRDAIASGKDTVLLVAGSIEQHGPHLPVMADSLVGKHVAEQAALRLGNALVAPVLQPALAEHHLGFPGTVTLDFEDFLRLLSHYCSSLADSGFRKIVLISSHGGNTDAMIAFAPRIAKRLLGRADVYMATGAAGAEDARRRRELAGKYRISLGKMGVHAGWMETSMVLALRPDLVDMTKAERGLDDDAFYLPENAKRNQLRGFALGVKAYSANGILGDPRGASAEAGRELLNAQIDELVRVVKLLTRADR